jgi:hypothetical protein
LVELIFRLSIKRIKNNARVYKSQLIRTFSGHVYEYNISNSKAHHRVVRKNLHVLLFPKGWVVEREFLTGRTLGRPDLSKRICAWAPTLSVAKIYAQALDNEFSKYERIIEEK